MSNEQPPRPPFKVSGWANIKHLNVRKEGPEDDKILAVDIKMEVKGLERGLCAFFDDALEAFLWRHDTDALIVRSEFLEPVKFRNDISGAMVDIGSRSFVGCDVRKFAITPKDGGVIDLALSTTVYPNADEAAELAKMLQDDITLKIEAQPDLFAQ